ncbi:DUF551 domain-containing protein [Cronobacter malonaticus]|uniref:DUF551 domain-containing protein n=1 Tax=Cronobacter malonaticus TaxID=413503 RepID=UPI00210F0575|nr:DUF551 domain-containing protein [Cronobacter malonaticus]
MSTISNERLEKLSEYDCADRYEVMSMATELLALRKERERAEPVAYMVGGHYLMHANDPKVDNYSSAVPLYTAPPATDKVAKTAVCPKCGNTGLADSGGVQPWGEPILIDCDCRYASTTHETDTTSQQFESLAGKAAGGWIACSERMPEREYVLAADFSGAYYLPSLPNTQVGIYADWFEDGKPSWDDGDGNDLHLKQVTHWMPLPEPPCK